MNEQTSDMTVERFEALVAPHLSILHGFACRRTGSPTDAEDLVQDTLLRAWSRIDSLDDLERVRPWLFTIMVHLHCEVARKRTRRQRIMPMRDLNDAFEERVVSRDDSPLDEMVRSRAISAVREALRSVPDHYAIALELRDLEGLSYSEIGRILGVPEGTAMSRVGRGRKQMAKLLAEWREHSEAMAA